MHRGVYGPDQDAQRELYETRMEAQSQSDCRATTSWRLTDSKDHLRIVAGLGRHRTKLMSAIHWKPKLWPVHTLEQAVAMIEEFTGEELTPEELEELRQVYSDEDKQSGPAH